MKKRKEGITYGTKICPDCGVEFVALSPTAVRCIDCRRPRNNKRQLKWYYENKDKPKKEKPPTLDERLIALKREGISYAEAQKRETIERYARVQV